MPGTTKRKALELEMAWCLSEKDSGASDAGISYASSFRSVI